MQNSGNDLCWHREVKRGRVEGYTESDYRHHTRNIRSIAGYAPLDHTRRENVSEELEIQPLTDFISN